MPSGSYRLAGDPPVLERFSCAAGPAGWRYTSRTDDGRGWDITLDSAGRLVRLEAIADGWVLRAGSVGPQVVWSRQPGGAEQSTPAVGLTGASAGCLLAVTRLLALSPGEHRDLALLRVHDAALAVTTVRERWAVTEVTEHGTDSGPLRVWHYVATDLDDGVSREVHVAGDVVVAASDVELVELAGPPTQPGGR